MSGSATRARTSPAISLLACLLLLGPAAREAPAQTPSSCVTFGYTGYTLNVTYDSGTDQTTYDITMHNLTPILGTFVNIGEVFVFGLPSPVSTASPPGWVFKEIGPKTFWDTTSSPWWKTPPAIKPLGDLAGFQYVISGAPVAITAIVTHVQQVTDATGQTSLPSTWHDCSVVSGSKCIEVTKSANPTTGTAGTVITYTFTVENCGLVPLTNVTVVDSLLGDITSDFVTANAGSDSLGPGASVTFQVTRAIQTSDPINLTNVVTACGTAPDQMQVCDSDSETVTVQKPCISILKSVDPIVAPVGTTVTYTFTVHNCGNVLLTNITVVDTLLGDITAAFVAAHGSNTLAPTVTVIFSVQRVVTSEQPNPIPNTVTVTGDDPFGNQVTDSDDGLTTIPITISGCAYHDFNCDGIKDPIDTLLPGATFTLTDILGNTVRDIDGNIVVHQFGSCYSFTNLPPGIYIVMETNPPGYVSTNALPGFNALKLTDDKIQVNAVVHTNFPNNNFLDCLPGPCISVACTVSPDVAAVGQTIMFTLKICNCGNGPLSGVKVASSQFGDLTAAFVTANNGSDALIPGQCVAFSVTHVASGSDPNPYVASFSAVGTAPDGTTHSASHECFAAILQPKPGVINQRRCFLPVTFTSQGWSDFCDPNNPIINGGMVYNRFARAFGNWMFYRTQVRNQLIVGRRYTITFDGTTTGLVRLCLFLPQGGPCGALKRNYVNPWQSTEAGALAGEAGALLMNIAYNDKRLMPRMPGYDLEDFTLAKGTLKGRTVGDVLNIANQVLSGSPPRMFGLINCAALVSILQAVNANYEFVDMDTFNDRGYLIPDRALGEPDPPHDPVVP